jgi:hypothetical protein
MKYKADDMDSVTEPLRPFKTKEKRDQPIVSGLTEDDDVNLDKCYYELKCEERVANIKEIMKPMEQTAHVRVCKCFLPIMYCQVVSESYGDE